MFAIRGAKIDCPLEGTASAGMLKWLTGALDARMPRRKSTGQAALAVHDAGKAEEAEGGEGECAGLRNGSEDGYEALVSTVELVTM